MADFFLRHAIELPIIVLLLWAIVRKDEMFVGPVRWVIGVLTCTGAAIIGLFIWDCLVWFDQFYRDAEAVIGGCCAGI